MMRVAAGTWVALSVVMVGAPLSSVCGQAVSIRPATAEESSRALTPATFTTFQAGLRAGAVRDSTALEGAPEDVRALATALADLLDGRITDAGNGLAALLGGDGGVAQVATNVLAQLLYADGRYDDLVSLIGGEPDRITAMRAGPPERIERVGGPSPATVTLGPRGHVALEVRAGAWRGEAWMDTGAALSVLSDSLAPYLGVRFESEIEIPFSTSTTIDAVGRIGVLPELRVGDARIESHRVIVFPTQLLRMASSEADWGTLHAILGWNALRELTVELDVPRRRYSAVPAEPGAAPTGPLTWMGYPLLTVGTPAGRRLLMGIDTGSWTTSLTPQGRRALGLEVAGVDTVEVVGVGGIERTEQEYVSEVELMLSDYVVRFDRLPIETESGADEVEFFTIDGVLGIDLLRDMKLTMDFKARRFDIAVSDQRAGGET